MKKSYFHFVASLPILLVCISFTLFAQKPSIYFEPGQLSATVDPNDSIVVHSVLHNATDYTVEFSFPGYTKGQGGPDAFGYSWIDSEEPGGPEWSWTDISEIGILVEGLGDDQMAGPYEMDFNFSYYGQTKNHFWISPNGVISFNEQLIPFANNPIPTNNNYTDFIAWFWDDLMIDSAISRVYFKNYEEKTVVQFTKMVHFPGTESFITGQVIMMVNGSVLIKYRLVSEDFEKTSATVGLQSWNSQQGLQVVYNAEYVHSELAVQFDVNRNFITSVTPASLTLQPGTQETIWITYSSVGFEPGSYEQDLKCLTSHPELPHLLLHNVMHVTNPNQAGFKGYVTDAATGYAINEVLVKVGEHQTYTNSNGYYELPLEQGSYNVIFQRTGYQSLLVEDTTALPGYSILDVELNGYYFIAGQVFAGDYTLETGFAYWYKLIEDEVVEIDADMIGEAGWYEFSGLTAANYIIKAEPSPTSEYYGTYLPTYYGDVLHWEEATIIELNQSTDDAHINLVPVTTASQGLGIIAGKIESSTRDAGIPVILRTTDLLSAYLTHSSTDGTYQFTGLDFGAYEVFAEIPGKSITPMTIILDESHSSVENVDMMIMENEIVFLGIGESEIFAVIPFVYPNPVKETMNLMIDLKKQAPVTLEIIDASGRTVRVESYTVNGRETVSIDVSGLSKGVYFLKIAAGGEVLFNKFLK
jgi:hypothetical protein